MPLQCVRATFYTQPRRASLVLNIRGALLGRCCVLHNLSCLDHDVPLDADYRIERSNRGCSRVEHYDSTEKRNALVQGPVRAFCQARLDNVMAWMRRRTRSR